MTSVDRLLRDAPLSTHVLERVTAPPGGARSHLSDGRTVVWLPKATPFRAQIAVDAETTGQPMPSAMARRYPVDTTSTFWQCWTEVEVVCKLTNRPVLLWLAEYGLDARRGPARACTVITEIRDDLVITWGVRANRDS